MNWRCADPVPHVLPLKFPFATHLRFPNPTVDPSSKLSPSRPSPSSLSFFLTLSETVAIISILLYHYNSSGNVRSFSRRISRRSGPLPRATHSLIPFIIVFHDISRFFLLQLLRDRQRGEASPYAYTKPRWILIRQTSMDIRIGINSEKG